MSELDLSPDRQAMTLFGDATPHAIVARATAIADVIAPLIRERQLAKRIGQSEHVFLEGWTLAGTMLGVFAVTVSSGPILDPEYIEVGYEATVEARTMAGTIVGRADAQCTRDENAKWRDAPSFQLRSMAITRASSKALRMPLGFVMKLAGYDTTPAEEMEAAAARGETVSGGKGVAPGWKDLAEQQRAHADLGQRIQDHGLREWVATWLESKGYERPLAKGQLRQLERAIEREVSSSRPAGDDGDPGRPAGAKVSAAEPQSPRGSAADQAAASPVQPEDGEAEGHPGLAPNLLDEGED
jgi:hypothetical protein